MNLLIIGYSNIVRRRVIPAVLQTPSITTIDVASRSSASNVTLPDNCKGNIFTNYDEALSKSTADLVYISTFNSEHAEWTEKALQKGFHVIVDKPSFTCFEKAKRLVALAEQSNLCLAESTVYTYHPQIQAVKDIFSKANTSPSKITVTLSFPPLNPDDFRYKKAMGGGALLDTGPYLVSAGRLFFNAEPEKIICHIDSYGGRESIDTSYSVLASYPDGKSMTGHFGFNTEYRNHINLLGPGVSISIDRIFTTTPDLKNPIHIKQNNTASTINSPAADSFALFIQSVISAIQNGNHSTFAKTLLSDASVLNRLRSAAESERENDN